MSKQFIKHLKEVKYPSKKDDWDIEGIIHGKTNRPFKFDLRPLRKLQADSYGKVGYFDTKAEKMVFDLDDQWVILDIEELHEYVKSKKTKDFDIDILIKDLDWNIIVAK
jgi:ATP-dependent protease HslVU (ClpYQ) ATPase subunit